MGEQAGIDEPSLALAIVEQLDDAYRTATWILRDSAAAEDAVQDAVALAWDRRSTIRDGSSARAWFARIVVNTCREELRRRARRARLDGAASGSGGRWAWLGLLDDAPAAADAVGALVARDEIGRALGHLGPDEQVLLALRFGRDLTVPEVAARLDLPEGTVKSRLRAALDHVRAALAAERRAEEAMA